MLLYFCKHVLINQVASQLKEQGTTHSYINTHTVLT